MSGHNACLSLWKQGAEAKIYTTNFVDRPCVVKERFSKKYRHAVLDKSLTQQRTKSEVRSMMRCRSVGIKTPAIYLVDSKTNRIFMEHISDGTTVRDHIAEHQRLQNTGGATSNLDNLVPLAQKIGQTLGKMHMNNIIHGDLTTSNMILKGDPQNLDLVLIDFGLGYLENVSEDKGVDLYVLERAFLSTHPRAERLFGEILQAYKSTYGKKSQEVITKFEEVRLRGRKRTMLG